MTQENHFISSAFDTGQSYRSMAWVARTTTIGLVISLLLNISLSVLISTLVPLKEKQPYLLVLKDKGEQVVQIEPILKNTKGMNKLIEGLCRQYVMLRETIDGLSEEKRWKDLAYLSSDEIYQEFYTLMHPQNPQSPFKKHQQEKVTRSVSIHVSSQVTENVWQVEWQSISTHQGQEIGRDRWVSTLQVDLRENILKDEDQFLNPIGFTVINYNVSKREE